MSKHKPPRPVTAPSHPLFEPLLALYETLASPPPSEVRVCHDCGRGCMSRKEVAKLLKGPSGRLSAKLLYSWYFSALDTEPSRAMQRYLLPRILDAMVAEEDVEQLGQPLRRFKDVSKPDAWREEQWRALKDLIYAYWRHLGETERSGGRDLQDAFEHLVAGGWVAEELLRATMDWPVELCLQIHAMGFYQFEDLWRHEAGAALRRRIEALATGEGPLQADAAYVLSDLPKLPDLPDLPE